MQLQQLAVVRRARDGEAATTPAFQQNIEVLPSPELQWLDGRQSQEHLHHVRRETIQARDPTRQALDLGVPMR